MEPKLPSRIDRAAFDRVLQRAAELQAASKDIGDGLSEDEVMALGAEVGIPAQHLRQALIEQRIQPAALAPSLLDRWIGSAEVASDRVVQGTQESIGGAITRWLNQQENFVVQRSASGRLTFEPMDALAGTMRRVGALFDASRPKPYLGRVELVAASITPLETGYCHVSLIATLTRRRRVNVGGALALTGIAAVGGGVMVVAAAPIFLFALLSPVLGASWVVAHAYQSVMSRVTVGLERLLDDLERNPVLSAPQPRSLTSGGIARGVGQVVRGITQEVRKALDE